MDLIQYLRQTLEDTYLSRTEKNTLKSILGTRMLDPEQANGIRAKIIELANEKVNEKNFRLVMEWMKDANSLIRTASQQSRVFFSPGDACKNAIIQQMNLSRRYLRICVFTISDDDIAHAILAAHRKGVSVRIITDNEKSFDRGSDIRRLASAGISVKMDVSDNHMHHKFMVADEQSLITGSYNWTVSAARFNHENILLTKEEGVIASYSGGFDQLWEEMVDYR